MVTQTTAAERIHSVDALRGFALFGILLANIPFSGEAVVASSLNSIFDFFHNQFIAHKFIAIFSMLFGFGFFIQFERFQAKGNSFTRYFLIRMLLLFIIGCLHAYLLWLGDIVRVYALGGALLLLVRNWPVKRLLLLAGLFAVVLTGGMYIAIDGFNWQTYDYPDSFYEEHLLTPSYTRYLYVNWRLDPWVNFVQNMPLSIFYTFGNMLIGFILGRIGFFRLPERLKRFTNILILTGFTVGLFLNYVFYLLISGQITLELSLIWLPFAVAAGMILQSLAYVSLFLRLYRRPFFQRFLRVFNPIGRMALTNYILQSVFFLLVFFHCCGGLRLYGQLTHGQSYLVVVILFVFQVLISVLWMRKFKQGPVEWLWKKAAYYYVR